MCCIFLFIFGVVTKLLLDMISSNNIKHKVCAIVAVGRNLGISNSEGIPWYIPDDLKHFKTLTLGHVVIMGSKTFMSLPDSVRPLPQRFNIVLTKTPNDPMFTQYKTDKNVMFTTYEDCCDYISSQKTYINLNKTLFIIGGSEIYKLFSNVFTRIYLTHIDKNVTDDDTNSIKYFPNITKQFEITSYSDNFCFQGTTYRFITYDRKNMNTIYLNETTNHDREYLRLCHKVLDNGEYRKDRTGTGTMSIFGEQMRFDISSTIPILTTKRIPWKSCIEELLWFLRGDTNAKLLDDKGVKIWNDNSSRHFLDERGLHHLQEGDCGANYSFQWKHFGAEYVDCNTEYSRQGTDQIAYIENLLKNDKYSRRIFLSGWNPNDLNKTVLPPCHVSAQFYVDKNDKLHCHMYQRSCDMFLGVPWNILSYSVLTYILAIRCNLNGPGSLVISTGDTHIYNDHINQVKTQLKRDVLCNSKLEVNPEIKNKEWNQITIDDFHIIGYYPHPSIKGKMSV